MEALLVLGWAVWLLISVFLVFELIGYNGLTRMFPEGRRWWHFPAQVLALVMFAGAAINNPWA